MSFLRVNGISYHNEQGAVLHDIHFNQARYQQVAIAGETGSGKSTLLKIIAGLIQPNAGQVWFQDKKVPGPKDVLLPGHPHISYLSQHFELRNHYRVEEVLEMANKLDNRDANRIFEVCQVSHLLKRKTDQLSGGEKQRIAVARLLIHSPQLLLLDEPFSNLDMVHKNIMKQVIDGICRQLQISCIMVSHEPADTLSWADEVIVMKDGKIVQQGAPQLIYQQPNDEYTAGLFGRYNLLTLAQTQAFSALPGISLRWDDMMIRPENLYFTNEANGARAIVKDVRFYGRFYEVTVMLSGYPLLVQTIEPGISKGDSVFVSLKPGSERYMSG